MIISSLKHSVHHSFVQGIELVSERRTRETHVRLWNLNCSIVQEWLNVWPVYIVYQAVFICCRSFAMESAAELIELSWTDVITGSEFGVSRQFFQQITEESFSHRLWNDVAIDYEHTSGPYDRIVCKMGIDSGLSLFY